MSEEKTCKCGNPRRKGGYDCKACHAAYMRKNKHLRPRYRDLSPKQRKKLNARAMVRTYIRRGKIKPMPCCRCGTMENLEAHHYRGYEHPLDVIWLCKPHHVEEHEKEGFDQRYMDKKATQKDKKAFDHEKLETEARKLERQKRGGRLFRGREK